MVEGRQDGNGAAGAVSGRRTRRKAPSPNSILDKRALRKALDDRGIEVSARHLEAFYQCLHRQNYPDLPTFLENYHRHEAKDVSKMPRVGPLKNNVSQKKNRNKLQLPKVLLNFLADEDNGFETVTSRVAHQKTSGDKSTTKLAVQLHDGQLVESVIMRYNNHNGSRASLCVSSQCGCAMGCTFCATGTMGLRGNLTSGEILEQMVHADRILAREWEEKWSQENESERANINTDKSYQGVPKLDLVRNVVFMGMGEPLDNYSNVVEACRSLVNRTQWNLAHGRVTVSTVGLVSQIRKLTNELPEINLALSLHAPNQDARTAIVPTASRYPIKTLIQALDEHMMAYLKKRKKEEAAKTIRGATGTGSDNVDEYTAAERIKESTRRRAMIEYVMLEGETSSFECARQLGKLCENRHLVVNLIPYNSTNVKDKLRCPSWDHMQQFRDIVASYGAFCTIRKTMGADIDSACGQLITLQKQQQKSEQKDGDGSATPPVRDIEDSMDFPENTKSSTSGPKREKGVEKGVEKGGVDKGRRNQQDDGKHAVDPWILSLSVATSLSAVCFVLATTIYLKRSKR